MSSQVVKAVLAANEEYRVTCSGKGTHQFVGDPVRCGNEIAIQLRVCNCRIVGKSNGLSPCIPPII